MAEFTGLRIAMVTPTLAGIGGTELYLHALLETQRALGARTTAFVQQAAEAPWPQIECPELSESLAPLKWRARAGAVQALADRLAREFDIVEFHRIAPLDLLRALGRRRPTALYLHTSDLTCPSGARYLPGSGGLCGRTPGAGCLASHATQGCLSTPDGVRFPAAQQARALLRGALTRGVLARVHTCVFNSRALQRLFHATIAPVADGVVLHPPLYAPELPVLPREPRRLLFCGRLIASKGVLDAVRAVALLPGFELTVVGEGPARAQAESLALELRCAERVQFTGWQSREEVARQMRRAACLLMPSRGFEAWGMAGPEALAQGCPVAAYDVGGAGEWALPGRVATVEHGNVRALADAARQLADLPEPRAHWREQALSLWGPAAFSEAYGAVLRRTLGPAATTVTQFRRLPLPGYHSIELLFDTINAAMPEAVQVRTLTCPEPGRGVLPRLRNLLWARGRAGTLNHIVGDAHYLALALPGARTVLTVHDCVALTRANGLRRALLHRLYFKWPAGRARVVTAISGATRDELARELGWDPARIRVIPNCVSPAFTFQPRTFGNPATLLLVGTLPHKNLERTVRAARGLPLKLHVLGALSASQRELLDAGGLAWRSSENLDLPGMVAAYHDCDIVGFASLYEGFGMPILEGQATGRPVLTSDLAPMRDVAGGAACLVNPEDEAAICARLAKLIRDGEYRQSLIRGGLENAARYSASAVAAQYAALYRELA